MIEPWKEPYAQLPMVPVYQTPAGDTFQSIQDAAVALGKVTANPSHALIRRPGGRAKPEIYAARSKAIQAGTFTRSTLLKEVRAVVKVPPESVSNLYGKQSGRETVERHDVYADLCVTALENHLEASWNSEARHIFMHSSGYDTRLIAGLLKRLHKKNGDAWLGEVRFCCFQPEIEYARKIFDHVGWPADTWHPIMPAANPTNYYASCLDFDVIGLELSESERFWGGPLLVQQELEADGWLRGPVQGVSALFGDETSKWNRLKWDDVGWFMGCWLFDNPGIMPGRPDIPFILPFVSRGWMTYMTRFYLPLPIDTFKLLMISRVDPVLADIKALPNWRFEAKHVRKQTGGHLRQQAISPAMASGMESAYRRSWYAETYGPATLGFEVDRVFRYWDDKNTHYIKAAIYEAIRSSGVEVVA